MALKMSATSVDQIGEQIWSFVMPPHEVRRLGPCDGSQGERSVLLFRACQYDEDSRELQFGPDDVTVLNVGTSDQVIGVGETPADAEPTRLVLDLYAGFGKGDREFLALANQDLSPDMFRVAETLLRMVRSRSSGELKRGKTRNFSETPDNFWYVIVQPRVDQLSITVRGPIEHFSGLTNLEIKDDRGNTRFKIRSSADLDQAVRLIFHALRKT